MANPIDPSRLPRPVVPGLAAEREATIARLQDAAAVSDDDAFDLSMLEERLELAMSARTIDELHVLTRDLPAVVDSPVPAVVEPAHVDLPSSKVSAIFSSVLRRGRRQQPRTMKVRAIFGSVVIDLREATFAPGVSTLHCSPVFGSVEVKVPPHVRVEVGGAGIFGSFEEVGNSASSEAWRAGSNNSASSEAWRAGSNDIDLAAASPDAPVLHVIGKAVFGSVEVMCRAPKSQTRMLPKP